MDRRAKVELFEQIRREHEFGGATIRAIARKFQVHRRLVRQALASAVPPERTYSPRVCPRLDPVKPFIDDILQADQKAPRKQRHTAQRIYRRLCQEWPQYPVGRSRVGEYVRRRKQELGLLGRTPLFPKATAGAWRGKWTGMKVLLIWAASARGCTFFVFVVWRAARRFIMPIPARRSKPFSK